MPDYQKGKIYKLISNHTDDIYIGSTCQTLSQRLAKHRSDFKRYSDGKVNYLTAFELCKYDDVRILLIKEYPCDNKEQLERKEGKYQDKYECVNKQIAGSKGICKHDKRKEYCRDCGGSAFCNHDKRKSYCRECDGSAFCKHDKEKSKCRDCGGSAFCKHDKQKIACRECGGIRTIKTKCPLCDKEMRKGSIKRHIKNMHKK